MPQPKKAPRFGGTPGHHNLLMSNLTTELFRHGRITTTFAKAKTVQPLADRMVTFAKRGDVHARRQVLRVIRDKDVVHKLFADVAPAFAERDGGYTRVLKTGPRKGDAAPMAIIELVEGVELGGDGDLSEEPRRRWSLRRRAGTLSASARARREDEAAAVDRGEEPYELEVADEQPGDEPAPAAAQERAPAAADEPAGPEADAAEVEARLAAADEDSGEDGPIESPVPAEEQDAPSEERLPDADEPDSDPTDDEDKA